MFFWPQFESRSAISGGSLLFCTMACTSQIWGAGFEPVIKTSGDATDKSPADNASKILTIEFLFLPAVRSLLFAIQKLSYARASFGFGLVFVWFVVSVPAVSAAVRIPCSQLEIDTESKLPDCD